MWHEQNFWDRILSTEPIGTDDDYHYDYDPSSASDEWKDVCTKLTKILHYILSTPNSEFDEEGTRKKLNVEFQRRIELPPKEAIGLAEAFIEAERLPKQAASMLIGNFLFQLYKKFYPGNPFKDDSETEEQASDA